MVGNGLDLGLGYKTSYIDCYHYLRTHPKQFGNELDLVRRMFSQFPSVPQWWSNFEHDLIYINPPKSASFQSMDGYYDNVISAITDLFTKWVQSLDNTIDNNSPKGNEYSLIKKLVSNANAIITFNYTKTIERHFNLDNKLLWHMHGCSNHPIFGHEPQKSSNSSNNTPSNIYNMTYGYPSDAENQYLNSMTKDTNGQFNKFKSSAEFTKLKKNKINKIVLFGVSYSKVDAPYYEYMYNSNLFTKNCVADCYYHVSNKNTRTEHNNNLAKNFGQSLVNKGFIQSFRTHNDYDM